jgi:hypothetical protein
MKMSSNYIIVHKLNIGDAVLTHKKSTKNL